MASTKKITEIIPAKIEPKKVEVKAEGKLDYALEKKARLKAGIVRG